MLKLCQTAKAQPCGEVKLKLEAMGTFWMAPSCSQKVSCAPRWVRIAGCYQSCQYLSCKHSDTETMEFTNWHGNSPVKDLSNATRRKWEGKLEGPSFTCHLEIMVLFALRSQTLWQHGWEAVQHCRLCRICFSPHCFLTQDRRTSVPTLPCIPVIRGTSAMTESLSSNWKRTQNKYFMAANEWWHNCGIKCSLWGKNTCISQIISVVTVQCQCLNHTM